MPDSDVEVVVVGGGAAGVAAAKHLHRASVKCLLVEARPRLGGRAYTVIDSSGSTLDLGCGWLHSADRNPWVRVAEAEGVALDKTLPPWQRRTLETGFPRAEQADFQNAMAEFFARLEQAAQGDTDVAAATLLEPGNRWNGLINSVGTYISGGDLDRLSVKDFDRYEDSGVNCRIFKGYGALIAEHGADIPANARLPGAQNRSSRAAAANRNRQWRDHCGSGDRDGAERGAGRARRSRSRRRFRTRSPRRAGCRWGSPTSCSCRSMAPRNSRGRRGCSDAPIATAPAVIICGPFGRPLIEAYFAGGLAAELEAGGEHAFFEYRRVRACRPVRK